MSYSYQGGSGSNSNNNNQQAYNVSDGNSAQYVSYSTSAGGNAGYPNLGSTGSVSYSYGNAGGAGANAGAGVASASFSADGNAGNFSASSSDRAATNQIASDLLSSFGGNGARRASSSNSYQASGPANNNNYLSEVEAAILRSNVPIDINESEEITVLGQRGIWANKAEVTNWRGVIPINQYQINEDASPEIITKRTEQKVEYIQELAIRYLRPPTPPAPGEIVITQELNSQTPPAPPLVIRQQPARPSTPEPLVVREAPPQPPAQVGRKVITISGKRLPPPPRKVVIERLAPLPSKPQSVIIERWLPYSQVKRRVIFQKSNERDAVVVKPRNVIIQWEAPQVIIKKDFKYLGIIRANPVEYVQRYGSSLKTSKELPDFVLDIKPPNGVVLAADYQYNSVHELEGDLQAMKLVDLDKEGLGEYRNQLQRLGINYTGPQSASQFVSGGAGAASGPGVSTGSGAFASSYSTSFSNVGNVIAEIFSQVDRDGSGSLSVEEAEKLLLRLNSRLGRRYGENDVRAFFRTLDINRDGQINLQEFRAAFERSL